MAGTDTVTLVQRVKCMYVLPMVRALSHLSLLLLLGLWASIPGTGASLSQPSQADTLSPLRLELVVYGRAGCVWCARWDNEIAPVYARTAVGQQAPMRRVDLDRASKDDPVLVDPVRFTPTFVLMRDGKEVGRITGYQNDGFFWGLLEKMVQPLVAPGPAAKTL
jgi:hypothetical protein